VFAPGYPRIARFAQMLARLLDVTPSAVISIILVECPLYWAMARERGRL